MESTGGQRDEAVLAALDRHDERRGRGIPTVSVLVGPVALAMRLVLQRAESLARPVVLFDREQPELKTVVASWASELAKNLDLSTTVVNWLARRTDRAVDSLERLLRKLTPYEIGMFLDSVLPAESETGVERVGRYLIERAAAGTLPGNPNLASDLDSFLEGRGRPWIRVFRALGELIPPECLPVLVFCPDEQNVTGLDRIARLLVELAAIQPRVGLALLVEPNRFDAYAAAPASRAKALLRESVINLPRPRLPATVDSPLASVELTEIASGDPIANDLESGTLDPQSETQSSHDDDEEARSAAERFLFERLKSVVETAGLFELNATLDFHFGPSRWIEVDLMARSLKLAVEVDGYHHFQDPEAFRRDRRKDLELQKHGYLVVRVLADDVVDRLEDVLDTIVATVAFRRAMLSIEEIL